MYCMQALCSTAEVLKIESLMPHAHAQKDITIPVFVIPEFCSAMVKKKVTLKHKALKHLSSALNASASSC